MPEARIILSEAAIYLAAAPKSNRAYDAVNQAISSIRKGDIQRVPDHLINGNPDYRYPHDDPRHWVPQSYLREPRRFYRPSEMGSEARIAQRLKRYWRRFRDGRDEEV
jgi:putative ATPase